MMKFLCFIIIVIFASCSNPTEPSGNSSISAVSCSLPDSLFALKNISSSDLAGHFYYDENGNAYTDSSGNLKLVLMDADQKRQYIDSIPPYDIEWITTDWQMHFVAKQDKIGSFTPIIVSAGGTDYSSMILVLLDSACRPVSHFILSGGECGEDPSYCDLKQSSLNRKEIRSYVRSIVGPENWYESDSLLVDSVNYLTQILEDGSFETRKMDSTRYKRISFIQ